VSTVCAASQVAASFYCQRHYGQTYFGLGLEWYIPVRYSKRPLFESLFTAVIRMYVIKLGLQLHLGLWLSAIAYFWCSDPSQ